MLLQALFVDLFLATCHLYDRFALLDGQLLVAVGTILYFILEIVWGLKISQSRGEGNDLAVGANESRREAGLGAGNLSPFVQLSFLHLATFEEKEDAGEA